LCGTAPGHIKYLKQNRLEKMLDVRAHGFAVGDSEKFAMRSLGLTQAERLCGLYQGISGKFRWH
jgi:hypothetical protein